MSVPEGKRGTGKFEVLVKALELAQYTIKITKNPKTFTPEYQSALTDDIIRTAKDIYIKCWSANNIRVSDADHAKKRIELQESAVIDTYTLTALIQIAKRIFHLSSKRVKFWTQQTVEVREYIRKWKSSDRKRYSQYLT